MLRNVRTIGVQFGAQRASMARRIRRWTVIRYTALCLCIVATMTAVSVALLMVARAMLG